MATPHTTCHIDLQPQGSIKTLKFLSHHLRHATNLFPNRYQNLLKQLFDSSDFSFRTLRKGASFSHIVWWVDTQVRKGSIGIFLETWSSRSQRVILKLEHFVVNSEWSCGMVSHGEILIRREVKIKICTKKRYERCRVLLLLSSN